MSTNLTIFVLSTLPLSLSIFSQLPTVNQTSSSSVGICWSQMGPEDGQNRQPLQLLLLFGNIEMPETKAKEKNMIYRKQTKQVPPPDLRTKRPTAKYTMISYSINNKSNNGKNYNLFCINCQRWCCCTSYPTTSPPPPPFNNLFAIRISSMQFCVHHLFGKCWLSLLLLHLMVSAGWLAGGIVIVIRHGPNSWNRIWTKLWTFFHFWLNQ